MRPTFLLALASLLAGPAANAQALLAGFDSPQYNTDNVAGDVAGQNGWTIDDATADLSFFVVWGYLGSEAGNNAAAVGAYLDSPVEPRVELSNTYGGSLVNSLTSLKFSVEPSTSEFPGRDSFGWTFRDSESDSLLSISLEPNPLFPDRLQVVWYDNADVRTATGYDLFYSGAYDLSVAIVGSGANASFSATITGMEALPFTGSLNGAAGATLSTFGASIARDPSAAEYGDNYLIFDNVSLTVIPEPASAMLAAMGLLFAAGRRRR